MILEKVFNIAMTLVENIGKLADWLSTDITEITFEIFNRELTFELPFTFNIIELLGSSIIVLVALWIVKDLIPLT